MKRLSGENQKRQVIVADSFYVGENEESDMKKIIAFFSTIEGAKPDKDLRHLK